jgi:hypothetical protein
MCFDDHQALCGDAAKESASPRKDTSTLVTSVGIDKMGDHIIDNSERMTMMVIHVMIMKGRMPQENGGICAQTALALDIVGVEINLPRNTRKP